MNDITNVEILSLCLSGLALVASILSVYVSHCASATANYVQVEANQIRHEANRLRNDHADRKFLQEFVIAMNQSGQCFADKMRLVADHLKLLPDSSYQGNVIELLKRYLKRELADRRTQRGGGHSDASLPNFDLMLTRISNSLRFVEHFETALTALSCAESTATEKRKAAQAEKKKLEDAEKHITEWTKLVATLNASYEKSRKALHGATGEDQATLDRHKAVVAAAEEALKQGQQRFNESIAVRDKAVKTKDTAMQESKIAKEALAEALDAKEKANTAFLSMLYEIE